MKKIFVLILFFLISTNAIAGCEDPINDGVDYTNCRFSDGQDLQGSYLPNSKLSFTSFIRANLYESILVGANFEKANFTGANLTRADFMGSTLIEANFQNSNLMEANFTSSNITNANFDGANLIGALWTNGETCGPNSIGVCNK
jgi:uncharacterized protein YjbI with pentapeptide repeats